VSAADDLIDRPRARAADPERRVDVRPSQFMAGVSTMDLGGLMGMLGSVSGDLQVDPPQERRKPATQRRFEGFDRRRVGG